MTVQRTFTVSIDDWLLLVDAEYEWSLAPEGNGWVILSADVLKIIDGPEPRGLDAVCVAAWNNSASRQLALLDAALTFVTFAERMEPSGDRGYDQYKADGVGRRPRT